jgi:hypothetical protein
MRAEVSIIGPVNGETAAEVTVQVAPEDRRLLGDRSWLRGELKRGQDVVDRFSQAVQFDKRGRALVEVVWSPGEYELNIEIETSEGARGIFVGKVTVPVLEQEKVATAEPTASAEPQVEQAPPGAEESEVPKNVDTAPPEPVVVSEPSPQPEAVPEAESVVSMSESEASEATPVETTTEVAAPREPEIEPSLTQEPPPRTIPTTAVVPAQGTTDLTLVVTLKNKPVEGLDVASLRVRVGREEARVTSLRARGSAPLLLGLVVAGASLKDVPELEQKLGRMVLNADDLFLISAAEQPSVLLDWGATAVDLPFAYGRAVTEGKGSVASAVDASLRMFEGRSGRKMLVVVTDGSYDAQKADWKSVEEAAQSSGVPILSVTVEGDDLNERNRRGLSALADASGGKSYSVRDAGMLKLVFDHFRDLAAATAELRFEVPLGKRGKGANVRVESADSRLDIRHSRRLR